jgi:hypothetical protein
MNIDLTNVVDFFKRQVTQKRIERVFQDGSKVTNVIFTKKIYVVIQSNSDTNNTIQPTNVSGAGSVRIHALQTEDIKIGDIIFYNNKNYVISAIAENCRFGFNKYIATRNKSLDGKI